MTSDHEPGPVRVWVVGSGLMDEVRPRLCEILIDCVEHGASVGFLSPLAFEQADAYWLRIRHAVAEGRCLLLVGALADGEAAGTVQLDIDTPPNQPHRATVCKLLVHTEARRRGLGEALMTRLEEAAAEAGRWLLTLDTATDDAVRLYERTGWSRSGVIPAYAMKADGLLVDTAFYWKELPHRP